MHLFDFALLLACVSIHSLLLFDPLLDSTVHILLSVQIYSVRTGICQDVTSGLISPIYSVRTAGEETESPETGQWATTADATVVPLQYCMDTVLLHPGSWSYCPKRHGRWRLSEASVLDARVY